MRTSIRRINPILGIDDSSFRDHLTYPKDLADYSRPKLDAPTQENPSD